MVAHEKGVNHERAGNRRQSWQTHRTLRICVSLHSHSLADFMQLFAPLQQPNRICLSNTAQVGLDSDGGQALNPSTGATPRSGTCYLA